MGKYDKLSTSEKKKKMEELKAQINKAESDYNFYKAMQLGLKLVLNGSYGAFCHPAFSVSNTDIANSITALAREVINFMLDHIEEYFYNKWGYDKDIHDLLGDAYVTEREGLFYIHRKDGKLFDEWGRKTDEDATGLNRIMNYYYLLHEDIVESDKDIIIWEEKEYKVIHKFHICDFSNVQPLDITYSTKPDKKSKDFDRSRGVRTVPIVIYGDTDSLYISFTPLAKTVGYEGDMLKFIHHINGAFIKFLMIEMLEEYAKPYGVKNIHDFELETINASGLHIQKKHYINNVVWEDGIGYDNLTHFYPKGIDIVKSSTPLFVRENIWEFIRYIFNNTDNLQIREVLKILKDIKKRYTLADIEDISNTTSLSNYEAKIIEDQSDIQFVKGAHMSIKAAALHNHLLNKNSSYKTKYDLLRGGKIKYYFCNHPKGDRFGYMRSFHPTEIVTKEGLTVDYDTQFEKTFLSICNRFLDPIGLPPINKRLSVLNSIFDISKPKKKEEKKKDFNNIEDIDIDEDINEDEEDLNNDSDDIFGGFWSYDDSNEEDDIEIKKEVVKTVTIDESDDWSEDVVEEDEEFVYDIDDVSDDLLDKAVNNMVEVNIIEIEAENEEIKTEEEDDFWG